MTTNANELSLSNDHSGDAKTLIDLLFKFYQEQCTQGRHHETQRAAVATATLAISAALIGVITGDNNLSRNDLPLTLLLIAVGIFSAVFSLKHYERFRRHMALAKNFRDAIDVLLPYHPVLGDFLRQLERAYSENDGDSEKTGESTLRVLKKNADKNHNRRFPTLVNLHLYNWWAGLCLVVSVIGLALTFIIIYYRPIK
ncbi:MAG TPA: hypothetical protein VHA56_07720 [Mucilaginibacter sp.]|nr:hypothetical protein [Mucilaginibacter sp.]